MEYAIQPYRPYLAVMTKDDAIIKWYEAHRHYERRWNQHKPM